MSEITNETHDEVNIRSLNGEVALSERYVRSVTESMPRRMRSVQLNNMQLHSLNYYLCEYNICIKKNGIKHVGIPTSVLSSH
jgi:hypothetical protein